MLKGRPGICYAAQKNDSIGIPAWVALDATDASGAPELRGAGPAQDLGRRGLAQVRAGPYSEMGILFGPFVL